MNLLFQSLPLVPASFRPFFYAMAALALALFVLGTLERMWLWTQGRDRPNAIMSGATWRQFAGLSLTKLFSRDCLFASRTFARSRGRGAMLLGIVWGSLLLLGGVLLSAVVSLSPVPLLGYEAGRVVTFLMDIAGAALLVGLIAALARRYFFHPAKWVKGSGDGFMLVLFTVVVLLGFLMEGARLAGTGLEFAAWSPVGAATGVALAALAGQPAVVVALYPLLYLLHAGSAFALIAYVPFSRLFHIFAAQITTFAARAERGT